MQPQYINNTHVMDTCTSVDIFVCMELTYRLEFHMPYLMTSLESIEAEMFLCEINWSGRHFSDILQHIYELQIIDECPYDIYICKTHQDILK